MTFDAHAFQPLVDKLKEHGELSSEYAAFKSADRLNRIIMIVMIVSFVAEMIANACGLDTKLGMILTAAIGIIAKVLNLMGAMGYVKSRTDIKTAAAMVVSSAPPAPLGPPAP